MNKAAESWAVEKQDSSAAAFASLLDSAALVVAYKLVAKVKYNFL